VHYGHYACVPVARWRSELRSTGRGFDSMPPRFRLQPSVHTFYLVVAQAGRVTVGGSGVAQATYHRHSGLFIYRLKAYDREMSTPPALHRCPAHFNFTLLFVFFRGLCLDCSDLVVSTCQVLGQKHPFDETFGVSRKLSPQRSG